MNIPTIRLAHGLDSIRPSLTNGPGWRVSFWTQGCSLLCTTQCLNPHFLAQSGGFLATVDALTERVLDIFREMPDLEGVTVLGGEPFDQAGVIAPALQAMRQAGLTAMVYTGHTYEELVHGGDPAVLRLLEEIDILVDGPFLPAEYSGQIAWRGSSNQRLLCLSNRYSQEALQERYQNQGKSFSIRVSERGDWSVSGLQERRGAAAVETLLRRPK
jgi:anaerobic ribonucleoside-triphosphate reductase activating protein